MAEKYLATITILTNDRQANAAAVQKVLTANSHLIMARLGVNLQRSCVSNCTGLIVVVVEGTKKEINDLTRGLDKLPGVAARNIIMTE